jgi:pimeloyl-ACP methyl ester carboxylesterase
MTDAEAATLTTTSATVTAPGAELYYEVCGSGPVLLVIQGGAGGAEGSAGLARNLADRFTVVSYDRRGFVRSPLEDPDNLSGGIGQHSDDASRLLAALTTEPAFVFGSSIGALIGLDLVARHPEQVRTLVAHEPPLPELLPKAKREAAVGSQEAVEEAYRRDGLGAAMRAFAAIAGLDVSDREPDVEMPRPDERRAADTAYFLREDAPAVRQYRVGLDALKGVAARIVAAAGNTSKGSWPHDCAEALAERLGTPFLDSPSGHSGYVMRPKAFAAWLRQVLEGPESRTRTSLEQSTDLFPKVRKLST